jgi:hypothetical protein
MFDLEQSISGWRRQMLAAGIKTPVPLEELEIHLREAVEQQVRAGYSDQIAFGMAVRQIGQTGDLQTEFAKVRETIYEQLKQFICAVAGIPNYQLATNMNIPNQNLEPRWATYLKSAALIFPAIFVWVGSCVFVVPKLKEICAVSGTTFPKPIWTALVLSDFIRNNLILGTMVILAALILLEWRSRRWPRYRRLVFGIAAFSLNFFALALIATMLVFAVPAGANLLHAK